MWPPDPVSDLAHEAPGIVGLDGVDDEVAAGLDVDPAVHAADAGDRDVVPEPGHGQVPRRPLALADEADHVSLGLVLVEGRVGDNGSTCNIIIIIINIINNIIIVIISTILSLSGRKCEGRKQDFNIHQDDLENFIVTSKNLLF